MLAQKQMDQVTDSFIDRLASQGYVVTPAATVHGRSGIERAFDYLVQRQYGLITYVIAIDVITNAEDPEVSLQRLFAFEDKCLDCNMEHRAIIAVPHLSSVANQFAQKDGVKVLDNSTMRTFLDRPSLVRDVPAEIPSDFREKSEVIATLRLCRLSGGGGCQPDRRLRIDPRFRSHRLSGRRFPHIAYRDRPGRR